MCKWRKKIWRRNFLKTRNSLNSSMSKISIFQFVNMKNQKHEKHLHFIILGFLKNRTRLSEEKAQNLFMFHIEKYFEQFFSL